jgi:virulence factor Mce-like protein
VSTPVHKRKGLFDYVPGKYRPKRVLQGVIFWVFALIFCWILYTKPHIPLISATGKTITGEVSNATDIYPGQTPVRVHGIDVGVVTGVKALPELNGASVQLKVNDSSHVVVHTDASFAVRWRTLLGGNTYIDLNPGSPSLPPIGDQVIPQSRTLTQVELDQVLEPFNATGRQSIQSMITEFDRGFSNTQAFGSTLQQLGPTMTNLAPTLRAVQGTQPGDLTVLVRNTNGVMAALAADEQNLGGLVVNGNTALGVTAARSTDLANTLQRAPGALTQTQATMARLRTTLDVVDPLAQNLVAGAHALAPAATTTRTTLAAAIPLLNRLVPLSRALHPSVDTLGAIGNQAPTMINSLQNTVTRSLTSYEPWLNSPSPAVRGLTVGQTIGPAIAGADSALTEGDHTSVMATFHGGAGGNALIDSPCTLNIFDAYTASKGGLADCQLLTQTLAGVMAGQPPGAELVPGSTLPTSLLAKFLTGHPVGGQG